MYTIIILARISEGHGGKRMKCALAAVGFLNGDVQHNQRVMMHVMKGCSGRADVVLFGEAFLQGFYGVAYDRQMALCRGDAILQEIGRAARTYAIAGGAALFVGGTIVQEVPSGEENVLFVEA